MHEPKSSPNDRKQQASSKQVWQSHKCTDKSVDRHGQNRQSHSPLGQKVHEDFVKEIDALELSQESIHLVNPFLATVFSHRACSFIWRELWVPPTQKSPRSFPNRGRHKGIPRRELCASSLGCLPPGLSARRSCLDKGMPDAQDAKDEMGNGEVHKMETHLLAARNASEPPTEAASAKTPRAVWGSRTKAAVMFIQARNIQLNRCTNY